MQNFSQKYFSNFRDYRHSFQGQEKDDEIKGEGNSVNYKYRMHDSRIGRFFAVDPLASKYPELTPYQFSGNNPIGMIEIEGLEGTPVHDRLKEGTFEKNPIGGNVFIPKNATVTQRATSDEYIINGKKYKIDGKTGSVTQFKIGDEIYTAHYNKETGEFTGYRNQDGELYTLTRGLTLDYQIEQSKGSSLNSSIAIVLENPVLGIVLRKIPLVFIFGELSKITIVEISQPVGTPKKLSDEEIKQLKDKGWDPHDYKPKQGGSGGKIDIYKDEAGNLFYKTEKGSHYEPLYENIKIILGIPL